MNRIWFKDVVNCNRAFLDKQFGKCGRFVFYTFAQGIRDIKGRPFESCVTAEPFPECEEVGELA